MKRYVILSALMLLMNSCLFSQQLVPTRTHAARTDKALMTDAEQYLKVELFFGLSENGKKISEKKWRHFVDEYITPLFPDGLSILNADGQWRNKDNKIIKERSKLLVLICKDNTITRKSIDQVKEKYRTIYHQESVLEVDTKTEFVSF